MMERKKESFAFFIVFGACSNDSSSRQGFAAQAFICLLFCATISCFSLTGVGEKEGWFPLTPPFCHVPIPLSNFSNEKERNEREGKRRERQNKEGEAVNAKSERGKNRKLIITISTKGTFFSKGVDFSLWT